MIDSGRLRYASMHSQSSGLFRATSPDHTNRLVVSAPEYTGKEIAKTCSPGLPICGQWMALPGTRLTVIMCEVIRDFRNLQELLPRLVCNKIACAESEACAVNLTGRRKH
jgi:hypothetical protein